MESFAYVDGVKRVDVAVDPGAAAGLTALQRVGGGVELGTQPTPAGVRHVRLGGSVGLPDTTCGLVDEAGHQAVTEGDQGVVGLREVGRITEL